MKIKATEMWSCTVLLGRREYIVREERDDVFIVAMVFGRVMQLSCL